MRAAYLQFAPSYLDVGQNLQAVDSRIQSIDADLIVLPELFTSGYFFHSREHLAQVAEPIAEGRSVDALRDWADALDATLVAGLAEQEGGTFYNSAVVVRPSGTVHTYRKVHLFYEEKTLFAPGDLGFRVFEVTMREHQIRMPVEAHHDAEPIRRPVPHRHFEDPKPKVPRGKERSEERRVGKECRL